eukprot:TRINITY_DN29055_c0_g1_i2.p1 TRINITY_DN29055_c0_g1~~TRINITY_DN29055_c0_g1_i2.p1  ORF type:complete len:1984 (+),score=688.18 TRINITY_DN29055_c0_g1_i2:3-5954(+)
MLPTAAASATPRAPGDATSFGDATSLGDAARLGDAATPRRRESWGPRADAEPASLASSKETASALLPRQSFSAAPPELGRWAAAQDTISRLAAELSNTPPVQAADASKSSWQQPQQRSLSAVALLAGDSGQRQATPELGVVEQQRALIARLREEASAELAVVASSSASPLASPQGALVQAALLDDGLDTSMTVELNEVKAREQALSTQVMQQAAELERLRVRKPWQAQESQPTPSAPPLLVQSAHRVAPQTTPLKAFPPMVGSLAYLSATKTPERELADEKQRENFVLLTELSRQEQDMDSFRQRCREEQQIMAGRLSQQDYQVQSLKEQLALARQRDAAQQNVDKRFEREELRLASRLAEREVTIEELRSALRAHEGDVLEISSLEAAVGHLTDLLDQESRTSERREAAAAALQQQVHQREGQQQRLLQTQQLAEQSMGMELLACREQLEEARNCEARLASELAEREKELLSSRQCVRFDRYGGTLDLRHQEALSSSEQLVVLLQARDAEVAELKRQERHLAAELGEKGREMRAMQLARADLDGANYQVAVGGPRTDGGRKRRSRSRDATRYLQERAEEESLTDRLHQEEKTMRAHIAVRDSLIEELQRQLQLQEGPSAAAAAWSEEAKQHERREASLLVELQQWKVDASTVAQLREEQAVLEQHLAVRDSLIKEMQQAAPSPPQDVPQVGSQTSTFLHHQYVQLTDRVSFQDALINELQARLRDLQGDAAGQKRRWEVCAEELARSAEQTSVEAETARHWRWCELSLAAKLGEHDAAVEECTLAAMQVVQTEAAAALEKSWLAEAASKQRRSSSDVSGGRLAEEKQQRFLAELSVKDGIIESLVGRMQGLEEEAQQASARQQEALAAQQSQLLLLDGLERQQDQLKLRLVEQRAQQEELKEHFELELESELQQQRGRLLDDFEGERRQLVQQQAQLRDDLAIQHGRAREQLLDDSERERHAFSQAQEQLSRQQRMVMQLQEHCAGEERRRRLQQGHTASALLALVGGRRQAAGKLLAVFACWRAVLRWKYTVDHAAESLGAAVLRRLLARVTVLWAHIASSRRLEGRHERLAVEVDAWDAEMQTLRRRVREELREQDTLHHEVIAELQDELCDAQDASQSAGLQVADLNKRLARQEGLVGHLSGEAREARAAAEEAEANRGASELHELECLNRDLVDVVAQQEQDINRLFNLQQDESQAASSCIAEQGQEMREMRQQMRLAAQQADLLREAEDDAMASAEQLRDLEAVVSRFQQKEQKAEVRESSLEARVAELEKLLKQSKAEGVALRAAGSKAPPAAGGKPEKDQTGVAKSGKSAPDSRASISSPPGISASASTGLSASAPEEGSPGEDRELEHLASWQEEMALRQEAIVLLEKRLRAAFESGDATRLRSALREQQELSEEVAQHKEELEATRAQLQVDDHPASPWLAGSKVSVDAMARRAVLLEELKARLDRQERMLLALQRGGGFNSNDDSTMEEELDLTAATLDEQPGVKERPLYPEVLEITVSNLVECSGEYVMVEGRRPNGFPLWKQRGAGHYLYSGTGCRWFLGDDEEEELDFKCNAGIVVSRDIHSGAPPHEVSRWQRFDGDLAEWREDPGIVVVPATGQQQPSKFNFGKSSGGDGSAAFFAGKTLLDASKVAAGEKSDDGLPPSLLLVAPGLEPCAGGYTLQSRRPNGWPLWKQNDGAHYLFSGLGGRWFVGDEEEEALDFACNAGVVVSREVHQGVMPTEVKPGSWQRFDGSAWVDDAGIAFLRPRLEERGPGQTSRSAATAWSMMKSPDVSHWTMNDGSPELEISPQLSEQAEKPAGEIGQGALTSRLRAPQVRSRPRGEEEDRPSGVASLEAPDETSHAADTVSSLDGADASRKAQRRRSEGSGGSQQLPSTSYQDGGGRWENSLRTSSQRRSMTPPTQQSQSEERRQSSGGLPTHPVALAASAKKREEVGRRHSSSGSPPPLGGGTAPQLGGSLGGRRQSVPTPSSRA